MNSRICPHCEEPITIKQAILLLNGDGYKRKVLVKLPDGSIASLDAAMVNPNEVEILDDYSGGVLPLS